MDDFDDEPPQELHEERWQRAWLNKTCPECGKSRGQHSPGCPEGPDGTDQRKEEKGADDGTA